MATSDLPEPVGVARTTFVPLTSSSIASSCAGYSTVPFASAQAAKSANSCVGVVAVRAQRGEVGGVVEQGRWSAEDIVGDSVPDAAQLPAQEPLALRRAEG